MVKAAPISARNEITRMAIIASYFLNDNRFASAAHSMIALDALVKLELTQRDQVIGHLSLVTGTMKIDQ